MGHAAGKAVTLWPQKRQGCAWPAPTMCHSWALWKAAKCVGVEEVWRHHAHVVSPNTNKQTNQKPGVNKTCVLNVRMPSMRDVLLVKAGNYLLTYVLSTNNSRKFIKVIADLRLWRLHSGKMPEDSRVCFYVKFLRYLNPASDLKRALRCNNISFIVFLERGRKSWKKPHDFDSESHSSPYPYLLPSFWRPCIACFGFSLSYIFYLQKFAVQKMTEKQDLVSGCWWPGCECFCLGWWFSLWVVCWQVSGLLCNKWITLW